MTMISGERKHFGLKRMLRAPREKDIFGLSRRVQLFLPIGTGQVWVGFSRSFIDFVGKAMPSGVSVRRPVCLQVRAEKGVYYVWAAYIHAPHHHTALWATTTKPSWIGV